MTPPDKVNTPDSELDRILEAVYWFGIQQVVTHQNEKTSLSPERAKKALKEWRKKSLLALILEQPTWEDSVMIDAESLIEGLKE